LSETKASDRLIAAAHLTIQDSVKRAVMLDPAQHFHLSQQEWTTEVAIHSDWSRDLYVILHGADEEGLARLTLIENPMVRWMWCGGLIMALGAMTAAWPTKRRQMDQPRVIHPENEDASERRSTNRKQAGRPLHRRAA
jgi:cytochrome c biogenesis factor